MYPSMDSAINLLLYTDKGYTDVMVTAEIAGFTQKYEQKVTLTPEMTYLMIKPPVLTDMPDLSTTKDTQMTLRVENTITGEAIIQETKNIALHSVYDYKNYSDEFGIIQNDNILAWMTPETDGILQVRRNAVSWLEQSFGTEYGMLPGYQPAYGFTSDQGAYITYYQVAAIQSAISKMSFTLREDGCVVLGGKTYDALGTDTVFEAAGIDPDEETAESKTEASSEASNAQTEPEVTPEPEVTVTPEPTAEPTPEATYTLVDYDGGVFTMQLPQGWQIMTGGEYAGYSIRAWDPNDPDVQIFYYGELGPYFKSAEAKAQYQSMSTSNDPLTYLPVLEDPTLAGCLNAMDDYQDAYDGIMPQSFAFAKIQNMTVLSETPITTPLASYAVSEASILASLTSETGAACTGMFEGSILDAGGYEINGVDVTPSRSASNIFGIIAPEGKFETVAPILIQSLTSFTFTDEYIQEAIRQGNMQAENAAEVSRRNSEMMERVVNDFCEYIRQ